MRYRNIRRVRGANPYRQAGGAPRSMADWRRLAESDPLRALAAQDLPEEAWWEIAKRYPLEAMQAPKASVFARGDPERWDKLERERSRYWVESYLPLLPMDTRKDIVAGLAEDIIDIFKEAYPGEKDHIGQAYNTAWYFTHLPGQEWHDGEPVTESWRRDMFEDWRKRTEDLWQYAFARRQNSHRARAADWAAHALVELYAAADSYLEEHEQEAHLEGVLVYMGLAAAHDAQSQASSSPPLDPQSSSLTTDLMRNAYDEQMVKAWHEISERLLWLQRTAKIREFTKRIMQRVEDDLRYRARQDKARKINEAEIRRHIAEAEASDAAEQMAKILVDREDSDWPLWLGLGLTAGGLALATFFAPETAVGGLVLEIVTGGATEVGTGIAVEIGTAVEGQGVQYLVIEASQWTEIDALIAAEQGAGVAETTAGIAARRRMMADLLAGMRGPLAEAEIEIEEGLLSAIGRVAR